MIGLDGANRSRAAYVGPKTDANDVQRSPLTGLYRSCSHPSPSNRHTRRRDTSPPAACARILDDRRPHPGHIGRTNRIEELVHMPPGRDELTGRVAIHTL